MVSPNFCVVLSLLCDAVPDEDDVLGDETNEVRAKGLKVCCGLRGELVTAAGLVTGSSVLGLGVDRFWGVGIFAVD